MAVEMTAPTEAHTSVCKHDREGALEYVGFNDLRCMDCGALGVTVCIWDDSIHTGPCGWCDDEPV